MTEARRCRVIRKRWSKFDKEHFWFIPHQHESQLNCIQVCQRYPIKVRVLVRWRDRISFPISLSEHQEEEFYAGLQLDALLHTLGWLFENNHPNWFFQNFPISGSGNHLAAKIFAKRSDRIKRVTIGYIPVLVAHETNDTLPNIFLPPGWLLKCLYWTISNHIF